MNPRQRIAPEEYARRFRTEQQRPALVDLLAARPELAEIGVAASIAGMEVAAC